jgi:hypothetical protein
MEDLVMCSLFEMVAEIGSIAAFGSMVAVWAAILSLPS